MNKRLLVVFVAVLLSLGALSLAAAANRTTQTWKGYVTDTWCGVNRVKKPPTATCTYMCVKIKGAKYAFFNLGDKKVYVLNPQPLAAKYAGELVTVKGTLGDKVQFSTVKGTAGSRIITASSISSTRSN